MTSVAAPRSPSVWEDFVDIFVAPIAVFTRRRGRSFLVPLLVLTAIVGILIFGTKPLMQPVYDTMLAQQEAVIRRQNPQLTEEQLARGRRVQEAIAPIAGTIAFPVTVLLSGLVLWLVGKLFDAQQTAGDALMVASYAFFPKILGLVIAAAMAAFLDPAAITSPYSVTLGAGYFLHDSASPVLLALLGRVDVITIWVTVLLGLGLHVTGNIPRGKAFAAAAIVWVFGAIPGLLQALRVSQLQG
jgi:hypothetical protein